MTRAQRLDRLRDARASIKAKLDASYWTFTRGARGAPVTTRTRALIAEQSRIAGEIRRLVDSREPSTRSGK